MSLKGGCHCGQIIFEVEGVVSEVIQCNCSMCQQKGTLMWFVPRLALKLLTSPVKMSTYTFNKHVIKHHFCPSCGIHPFGEALSPNGQEMVAINVRCLEGLNLSSLKIQHFNGRDS
jgi:hypothetical protein